MTISKKLKEHLERERIAYDTIAHPRTATTSESAQATHVPGDLVAKGVLIHHERGYVLAVAPSTRRLNLSAVQDLVGARLGLASEKEIESVFEDCLPGAVPPVGAAYDLPTLLDESLNEVNEVYFEGGDHRTLVLVSGQDFRHLLAASQCAAFSEHV
ncbi:aminoacyl-tRNA deacylase [Limibaculum sp. M0105]|uniref:Aminoacyl-tRNA deacylase n=1 Tax=Thermohalobaculum xanthum TaxID=2753746 RepID=A0A8J7M4E8_9RHOB|nr:aminoacyl-tRNA deacylase [Thermohalobaculum xanthum]MBK0398216.1 aminoacyl-tRNA deacylase [Thermohalobaculum xanthum]